MKEAVCMLALSLVSLAPRTSVFAKPILRHVEGLHGIEANAGITAIGKSCAIDWSYYFTPCWQIKAGIGAEIDKFQDSAYRNIFTQPVVAHTLFTNYSNVFLNVLGGANLHLESYRHKKQKKPNNNFNIGLVLGGELELFLVQHWAAFLSGGSRIFFLNSPCGKMDYFLPGTFLLIVSLVRFVFIKKVTSPWYLHKWVSQRWLRPKHILADHALQKIA